MWNAPSFQLSNCCCGWQQYSIFLGKVKDDSCQSMMYWPNRKLDTTQDCCSIVGNEEAKVEYSVSKKDDTLNLSHCSNVIFYASHDIEMCSCVRRIPQVIDHCHRIKIALEPMGQDVPFR